MADENYINSCRVAGSAVSDLSPILIPEDTDLLYASKRLAPNSYDSRKLTLGQLKQYITSAIPTNTAPPADTPSLPAPSDVYNVNENGYTTLPGGVIMQWGVISPAALNQSLIPFSFNTPFTIACYNLQLTILLPAGFVSGSISPMIKSFNLTGGVVVGDHTFDASTGKIYWTAIGI